MAIALCGKILKQY